MLYLTLLLGDVYTTGIKRRLKNDWVPIPGFSESVW